MNLRVDGDGCYACGDCKDPGLYVRLAPTKRLCAPCWHAAGRPGSEEQPPPPSQLFAHETRTREHMTKRGGTARHLVRKGLA